LLTQSEDILRPHPALNLCGVCYIVRFHSTRETTWRDRVWVKQINSLTAIKDQESPATFPGLRPGQTALSCTDLHPPPDPSVYQTPDPLPSAG